MKLLLLALSATVLTAGCSQPKNRLTDDKNVEYQKKLAKANKATATQKVVVDVPNAQRPVIQTNLLTDDRTIKTSKNLDQDLEVLTIPKRVETAVVEEKTAAVVAATTANTAATATVDTKKTEESRAQAQADIAKIVEDSKKVEGKTESQKATSEQQSQESDVYQLTLKEVNVLFDQVALVIKDQNEVTQIPVTVMTAEAGIDLDNVGFRLESTDGSEFTVGIAEGEKELALYEKVAARFNAPVKMMSKDGIELISACADEKCEILMNTFRKYQNNKLIFNISLIIKIVDGKLQRASLKPVAEYQKEMQAAQGQQQQAAAPRPAVKALDLAEYTSITEQITRLVGNEEQLKRLMTPHTAADVDPKKLGFGVMAGGVGFVVGYNGEMLTAVKDVKLKFETPYSITTQEGYNFNAVCNNDNCDIVFVAFTKVENKQMTFNMPIFLRKWPIL